MDRNLGRQSWKVKVERKPGPFLGGSAGLARQEQGYTGNGSDGKALSIILELGFTTGAGVVGRRIFS